MAARIGLGRCVMAEWRHTAVIIQFNVTDLVSLLLVSILQ